MSAAPQPVPAQQKKPVEALMQGRLQLAETARNTFRVYAPNGTQIEDLLDPAYWAHVSSLFHMFDFLEVFAEDGAWYVQLIVVDAGRNFARVAPIPGSITLLQPIEPDSRITPVLGHMVKWAGVHAKFRVTRDSDGKVLKDKFESKAAAWTWLDNYAKSFAQN